MKTIKVRAYKELPTNFTGIAEYSSGDKYWFKEGKLHHLDGPAREYANGTKEWLKEDKLHRLDGPAYEGANGNKAWYIAGKEVTEEDFPQAVLEYKLKMVLES